MLLKMSFYNECLSSLTLQESNPTYTYTRCLEYYSRVQDFCLTLFSQVAVFPFFSSSDRTPQQRRNQADSVHRELQNRSV